MGASQEQRVLAVTSNASLVIGLTFLAREWDVASRPPEEAAGEVLDADVVVFDLGSVRAGIRACEQVEPGTRVVVIGDDEPAAAVGQNVEVLIRPYTMDDLAERIDRLLAPAPAEAPTAEASGQATPPGPDDQPQTSDDATGGQEPSTKPTDADVASGSNGRGSLASRLFGRLAQPDEPSGDPDPDAPADVASDEQVVDLVALEEDSPPEPDPDASAGPPGPRRSGDDQVDDPHQRIRASEQAGTTAVLERRVIHVAEPPTVASPARPTRWRARRAKELGSSEQALRERLARVLAATSELERLVEEVPLLSDLPTLCAAVVREIQGHLEADTVGLWRPAAQGWQPTAHYGFTSHEATWTVPFDQPLFSEVHANGGAMLLDPVDEVQAAVAGIGGAHTESFMAAAIAAGPGRYGILAVGRDQRLVEGDLDVLGDLALEMAPGMAVAEQLLRLQQPGRPTAPQPSEEAERRPWRREGREA